MSEPKGLLGGYVGNPLLGPADQEDRRFDAWFRALPWFREFVARHSEEPNPSDPDYDYRAAYRAGVAPERYAPDGGAYHWPSAAPDGTPLKSRNHPTMWAEEFMRATGRDPFAMGIKDAETASRVRAILADQLRRRR